MRCHCHSRSEEHTSELQSHVNLVCRLLLEKKTPTKLPRADSFAGDIAQCWGGRQGGGFEGLCCVTVTLFSLFRLFYFLFIIVWPASIFPLFPYTTLFRSRIRSPATLHSVGGKGREVALKVYAVSLSL